VTRAVHEVDLDHAPPGVRIGVGERTSVCHSGVGDDNRSGAQTAVHHFGDAGHRLVVGDVHMPVQ
jgi:DNA-binding LacI/PurR family transcriptional regulator